MPAAAGPPQGGCGPLGGQRSARSDKRGGLEALVVEDDPQIRQALCAALPQWGFTPRAASSGAQGLALWGDRAPQVVLLDLGLPDMDGLDVLQRARARGLAEPVLLLTARATVGDRVLGLNFGADDYLSKPFDYEELRARLCALVRRSHPELPVSQAGASRSLGLLQWDAPVCLFSCHGQPLSLTPRESALLRALLARPNCAQPKEQLLQAVFPRGHVLEEALEVVAHRLRRKLVACGVAVVTLRGLGYLIKEAPAAGA